jgi:cytosine/adenosine deaminase-related metal-dependent hydrolase
VAARDLHVAHGHVVAKAARGSVRLEAHGTWLLPALVNAHDHLGLASYPAVGSPPYANVYEWAGAVEHAKQDPTLVAAAAVPLHDRLLLGGLRNLFAGVGAVVHHDPIHPLLVSPWRFQANVRRHHGFWPRLGFPIRVARRLRHAHSLGYEPDLALGAPASGERFMLHAAEGRDARAATEIATLTSRGLLGPDTVLVHALAASVPDIAQLAARDTAVVWCPQSNLHLYGATAPVARLQAAGVRLALGSDSSLSGVRDALSNLASARACGVFEDVALLDLATRRSAAVFGLPVGGTDVGDVADWLVVDEPARLLAGERGAVQLVVVAGRALYGRRDWLATLGVPAQECEVDGHPRALHADLARLLRAIVSAHPAARRAPWLATVR